MHFAVVELGLLLHTQAEASGAELTEPGAGAGTGAAEVSLG